MRSARSAGSPFELLPKNSLQLKPRTVLRDQYLIWRALGHGGFGITYLAWDTNLEARLAVKEYMPNGVAGRCFGRHEGGRVFGARSSRGSIGAWNASWRKRAR